MPLAITIPYMIIEALAFYGVAKATSVGWALIALLLFFFGGLLLAAFEMRRIAFKLAEGRQGPGSAMGDLGLVAAGSLGVALPGFVSTILGLLLIITPTRAVVRRLMARQIRARVETFGTRAFETAASYGTRTNYGSFGAVIDETPSEEEVARWSRDVDPDDFRDTPPNR